MQVTSGPPGAAEPVLAQITAGGGGAAALVVAQLTTGASGAAADLVLAWCSTLFSLPGEVPTSDEKVLHS